MTGADLWVYPLLMLLQRAGGKDAATPLGLDLASFAPRYKAIDAWSKRIEALPYFGRTYPPHWKQAA